MLYVSYINKEEGGRMLLVETHGPLTVAHAIKNIISQVMCSREGHACSALLFLSPAGDDGHGLPLECLLSLSLQGACSFGVKGWGDGRGNKTTASYSWACGWVPSLLLVSALWFPWIGLLVGWVAALNAGSLGWMFVFESQGCFPTVLWYQRVGSSWTVSTLP